jgi:hypothetical protein
MIHIHKWALCDRGGAYCPDCDTELYPPDIIKRLNDLEGWELLKGEMVHIDELITACEVLDKAHAFIIRVSLSNFILPVVEWSEGERTELLDDISSEIKEIRSTMPLNPNIQEEINNND